jgi:hypothetical protein
MQSIWPIVLDVVSGPIFRSIALIAIVLITIRAMGSIYGGPIQNGMFGPIAIRPHSSTVLRASDIRIPRALGLPIGLDGVHADCDIYFVYSDRSGRKRRHRVFSRRHMVVNVVPNALTKVQNQIDGQEITPDIGALSPEDVVIPVGDTETENPQILATPTTVQEYVTQNRVLEAWTDDDAAIRVSVHRDLHEELGLERERFIVERATALRAAREGNWWKRRAVKRLAANRPSVIGSYYVKFRMSKNPFFILTRHPDRDLKMTAWLTLLTSLFAMIMEAWPLNDRVAQPADGERTGRAPVVRPQQ